MPRAPTGRCSGATSSTAPACSHRLSAGCAARGAPPFLTSCATSPTSWSSLTSGWTSCPATSRGSTTTAPCGWSMSTRPAGLSRWVSHSASRTGSGASATGLAAPPATGSRSGSPGSDAWADLLSRVSSGAVLAVDYGHERDHRPADGTLTAYRHGAQVHPRAGRDMRPHRPCGGGCTVPRPPAHPGGGVPRGLAGRRARRPGPSRRRPAGLPAWPRAQRGNVPS